MKLYLLLYRLLFQGLLLMATQGKIFWHDVVERCKSFFSSNGWTICVCCFPKENIKDKRTIGSFACPTKLKVTSIHECTKHLLNCLVSQLFTNFCFDRGIEKVGPSMG